MVDTIRRPGGSFDLVCLFHVLEHIIEPAPFLESCTALLVSGGRIIIEVPSLEDPLLSLYHVDAYQNFFFQTQHPYSYSAASLGRLLDAHGLAVDESIAHQRYGLENHWRGCAMANRAATRRLRLSYPTSMTGTENASRGADTPMRR